MRRYNNGLATSDAIGSAINTYGALQNIESQKQSMGLRDADAQMRKEEHQARMDSHQEEKQLRGFQIDQIDESKARKMNEALAWSLHNAKDMPDEHRQLIASHPNLNAQRLMSDEAGKSLQVLESAAQGKIDYRSPEVAAAFDFLNPEIALGATDGRKVKTARLYPGKTPETLVVGLSVEGDERVRPLTKNRSADDADEVREVPIDSLIQRAQLMKQYRTMLMSEQGRNWLLKTYLPQSSKTASEKWGPTTYNEKTGMYEQSNLVTGETKLTKGNAKGAGGAGGELPAKAQMIGFYSSMGYSDEDSIAMANDSVSSPEKFTTSYSKMLLESSKDGMGNLTLTPEQAMEQSLKVYNANFRKKPSKKDDSSSSAQPEKQDPINAVMDMAGVKPKPEVKIPMRQPVQAPPAALDYLKSNPDQAKSFKAKYGYLPEGY